MRARRLAINGFGRIGRVITRLLWENHDIDIVAINDLTPSEQNAHLLQFDSVHGRWGHRAEVRGANLLVDGSEVHLFRERDPALLPWKELDIDIVLECTGAFRSYEGAEKHLKAGGKRVILSAPAKGGGRSIPTIVMGVNEQALHPSDMIVSNASCTTNCLAPVVKVLHDVFGVRRGLMTTVHSYTNDQRLLDLGHKDFRRMRAAGINIIPTSTGAALAVAEVMPELKGKLTGISVRVPTANVSLVDFVADTEKSVTVDEVNDAFLKAENQPSLRGIIETEKRPLVSSDFNGSKASATVDLSETMVVDESMVKVVAWYDNETGFSQRMIDLAGLMARSLS